MAIPKDSPANTPLPRATLDDLLAPLPEIFRLGGPGPFVINLCSSSVSMSVPASIAGCRQGRIYQIQRREEDLVRYRLRLGPFATENDADALLTQVREAYPGALTATASHEDLRALDVLGVEVPTPAKPVAAVAVPATAPLVAATAIAGQSPHVLAPPRTTPTPAPQAAPPSRTAPPPQAAPAPRTAPSQQAAPAPRTAPSQQAAPPAPRTAPPARSAPPPQSAPPARSAPPPQSAAAHRTAPTPRSAAAHRTAPTPHPAPTPRAAPPQQPLPNSSQGTAAVNRNETLQSLEHTQTLRQLTPSELESEGALRWYVIQLSLSDTPVDPHTVPMLDIFSLYRLYSVSGVQEGRVMHALRLGFFGEQIAARAVANYLTEHYANAVITRVSVAERERFADQGVEARKDIGATGTHTAIEITADRIVRPLRKTGP